MTYKKYVDGTSNIDELAARRRWMPNGRGGWPLAYKPVDVESQEYRDFIADPKNKDLILTNN